MDSEMIYAVVGIIVLGVVILVVLNTSKSKTINTKEAKREAILQDYKNQLHKALSPFENDKDARVAIKNKMLKKFSDELSLNIFFDADEIKEIILELIRDS